MCLFFFKCYVAFLLCVSCTSLCLFSSMSVSVLIIVSNSSGSRQQKKSETAANCSVSCPSDHNDQTIKSLCFLAVYGGGDGGNAAMMTCSSRVRSVWWKVFLWGSTLAPAMLWTKCQSLRANISTMYNVWSCRRHDLWRLKEKRTDMADGKVWLTVRRMKCQSHGSALL